MEYLAPNFSLPLAPAVVSFWWMNQQIEGYLPTTCPPLIHLLK